MNWIADNNKLQTETEQVFIRNLDISFVMQHCNVESAMDGTLNRHKFEVIFNFIWLVLQYQSWVHGHWASLMKFCESN